MIKERRIYRRDDIIRLSCLLQVTNLGVTRGLHATFRGAEQCKGRDESTKERRCFNSIFWDEVGAGKC